MNSVHVPSFPIRVSAGGRFFTEADGTPFYWLGDTQWELVCRMPLADAKTIVASRKEKGFTVIMAMLLGIGASGDVDGNADGRGANSDGERPWVNDDPAFPNEKYFANVDTVLGYAGQFGLTIALAVYHARAGSGNPLQMHNARAWGRWLGERYRETPNLVWSMCPRAEPESLPMARELARGLREGDGGRHLVGVHPDPAPASSSTVFHRERWLAFNTVQTFKWVERIFPMVTEDRARRPRKPVVMAEGAYEDGIEYGFPVTAAWIRRQAYYSCLAGGYHSYGHNDFWRVWPSWRKSLEAPGASQVAVMRSVLAGLFEWWQLFPDRSLITEGRNLVGDMLTLAARHPRGKWIIVYQSGPGTCVVGLAALRSRRGMRAALVDPRTGDRTEVVVPPGAASIAFATPPGWEDALLVVEAR